MSNRRPEKLWVRDEAHRACEHEREASPAVLVAAVRRGVESGTIRGDLLHSVETSPISGHVPVRNPGWYLVIPVDGGES